MKFALVIASNENGLPAYEVLSKRLNMSRLLIKKIRLYGSLLLNGEPSRMKDPVCSGDTMEATLEDERRPTLKHPCDIKIYYEDEWIIVCEKPSGLVTHPSWQHMNDSLIQRLSDDRLHPVMRLDRETSGMIVVAKNGYAHDQIISEKMHKEYLAIVYGQFDPASGIINLPIGRSDHSIMIRVVREDGKKAVTRYATLLSNDTKNISLIRFVLETGRCHQIRVHARHLGHPLVGDGLYGPLSDDYPAPDILMYSCENQIERQALHASFLSFTHPFSREWMSFHSPLPTDMLRLLTSQSQDEIISDCGLDAQSDVRKG